MAESNDFPDALPKEMQAHHYPILYEVEETHWWYVGRRRLLESFIADLCLALNRPGLRILDVGCGTGANLKMLARYGESEGIDVSQQALDFCRLRGIAARFGAAESLPYDDGSFDLVTALDVLEHLDDDRAGLEEIRRVLRPGGRALLFVPAFMFLWGVQDEVSNHRRRYTLPELSRAVTAAGLEVERASYANFAFFFPVLLVRSAMRLLKLHADTEYGINVPLMNKLFGKIFAAERFVLRRGSLPFGVSVLCIARKAQAAE